MSSIKQLWALARFQLAIKPTVLALALGGGFPCISQFILFRNTKFPLSLDLLISNQLIYCVLIFGPMLLAPDLGSSGKTNRTSASGTEFLITRAVDWRLLFRSRSLLFYLLLLVIPIISLVASLHHPELKIYESHASLFQRTMHEIPGSISGSPDTDGKITDIIIPHGNTLVGCWRIWLPLCIGVMTVVFLTLSRKVKYGSWLLLPLGCAFIFYFCFPRVFFHASPDTGRNSWDLNTALFFFYAAHQTFCWLIAISALFVSLFWYEQGTEQFE